MSMQRGVRTIGVLLLFVLVVGMPLATMAQSPQFGPPQCANNSADSTCYSKNFPATACSAPPVAASMNDSCPAGYFGRTRVSGTRDACTGQVTWNAASGDMPGCTSCPNSLTASESSAVKRSLVEASELLNLTLVDLVCPGFSCVDGAAVNDPTTGGLLGRIFRDHVWITNDGFTSGQLPTLSRTEYLLTKPGEIFASIPAYPTSPIFAALPKTPEGYPITNVAKLYAYAIEAATNSGYTSCIGNDKDHCDMTCTKPATGWLGDFCEVKTVGYWGCSDSYAVNTGSSWQPTPDVQVPYTTGASPGPGDYTQKTWSWPSVFAWNGPSVNPITGGNVYLCESTIHTCNGWNTNQSTYKCRTPSVFDCSYTDSSGTYYNQTCTSCDPAYGAVWDYELIQDNDCPLAPGVSTRVIAGDVRTVWQGDVLAAGCPVNTPH